LRNNAGEVLDSSEGKDPLYYLHGFGNLIPGMEEGLEGKVVGDKFQINVSPEKGYGVRNEEAVQEVPREAFGDAEIQVGMQFRAGNDQGQYIVTIVEVGTETVKVDGNHPLAGVELQFDVEIMEVRDASSEEVAHGHVHGPHGHNH
jgi:FKBP-type peptidyl-prolyl cis-trans isomerase SlyD